MSNGWMRRNYNINYKNIGLVSSVHVLQKQVASSWKKYLLSTAVVVVGGVGVRVHGGPVIFQSGADAVRMKQRWSVSCPCNETRRHAATTLHPYTIANRPYTEPGPYYWVQTGRIIISSLTCIGMQIFKFMERFLFVNSKTKSIFMK